MINPRGPYRVGAFFSLIAAGLHVVAVVASGFATSGLMMLVYAIVFAVIGIGLMQGWRWLAYLSFFVLVVGGIFALGNLWSVAAVPAWCFLLILVASWLGAMALFAALWRSAPGTA